MVERPLWHDSCTILSTLKQNTVEIPTRLSALKRGDSVMKKVGLLAAVLVLLCTATTLRAQTSTGQISGTVRDATGAVVPGAAVTVSNDSVGFKRTITTDGNGDYVFPVR